MTYYIVRHNPTGAVMPTYEGDRTHLWNPWDEGAPVAPELFIVAEAATRAAQDWVDRPTAGTPTRIASELSIVPVELAQELGDKEFTLTIPNGAELGVPLVATVTVPWYQDSFHMLRLMTSCMAARANDNYVGKPVRMRFDARDATVEPGPLRNLR